MLFRSVELDPASGIVGVAAAQGMSSSLAALNQSKLALCCVSDSGASNVRFVGEQPHNLPLFVGGVLSMSLVSKFHPRTPTNAVALGMYNGGHCYFHHILPISAL